MVYLNVCRRLLEEKFKRFIRSFVDRGEKKRFAPNTFEMVVDLHMYFVYMPVWHSPSLYLRLKHTFISRTAKTRLAVLVCKGFDHRKRKIVWPCGGQKKQHNNIKRKASVDLWALIVIIANHSRGQIDNIFPGHLTASVTIHINMCMNASAWNCPGVCL